MTIRNDIALVIEGTRDEKAARALHILATHIGSNYASPAEARRIGAQEVGPRLDAKMDPAAVAMLRTRMDDATSSAGVFSIRELEARLGPVLEEKRKPTNLLTIFPTDSSVPAGAEFFTAERTYASGRADWYRGRSSDVPKQSVSKQEERRSIKTVVSGFDMTIFEVAAAAFAGFPLQSRLLRQARQAQDEFINLVGWYGDTAADVWGVLNFPWTPKYVSAQSFTQAAISAGPDAVIAELNFICNEQYIQSGGVLRPTDLVMPPAILARLRGTPRSATTDTSVLAWFVANNPFIASEANVHDAWELDGVGPGGTSVIMSIARDAMSGAVVLPQGFTMLPVQENGFELEVNCYSRFGGFYAREGNNLIAYVTA